MSDSSEGLFDCSEEPQVGLTQLDLKSSFRIRISLVDGIALLAPGSRNRALSFGACDRHFASSF
jgi:hypothetical protein